MANEMLSEKVSVNINSSTLSGIDLLVDNGYYSNRSDFINQAVRDALQTQQTTIDRIIAQNESARKGENWFIGLSGLTKGELEELHAAGERMAVRGYGVFTLPADVDEEKLFAVVESISVKGKVYCSKTVKEHYGIK